MTADYYDFVKRRTAIEENLKWLHPPHIKIQLKWYANSDTSDGGYIYLLRAHYN